MTNNFRSQLGVIHALLVRDALKRYGHENLGFFWVVAEPLAFTIAIMILWNLQSHEHSNLSITAFALSAYSMLTMFRHLSQGFVHVLHHNMNVLFHSTVKAFDLFMAHGVLETISCLSTFFIAYVPLALLGIIDPIRDPLLVFGAWFLTAWFSFAFGITAAGLTALNDVVERLFPAFMYVTLPLTGAFTMQDWLPPRAREILQYSPLVNLMEMFRCGLFSEDVMTYWNLPYVLCWCLGLTVIGLLLIEKARNSIEMS
ncbi:MAG: ABC transporter permease [Methylovirgula sp.]|uniref:ABC transporter permease n=1 Tax=Methylovirgula sp. TaxID=1978224 RepID=UPI0030767AF2